MKKILKSIWEIVTYIFDLMDDLRHWNFTERRRWRKERAERDIIYEGLPYRCRDCELLGMCRRPKEQGWKCYHGCIIINQKRAEEQERSRQK